MNGSNSLHRAVLERIAKKIKELRIEKGLTQESLCQEAGLAPRHLQKIENAEVNVTVSSLVKIAKGLDVDVSELFLDGING